MQDPIPVLIAVCGISFVCIGALLVVGFIFVKTTGLKLLDMFGGLGAIFGALQGGLGDVDSDDVDVPSARASAAGQRRNLRSKAQDLDFDSAVQKYSADKPGQSAFNAQAAPPAKSGRPASPFGANPLDPAQPAASDPLGGDTSQRSLRSRPRRRRDESEQDDDVLGGLLDDDGLL